MNEKLTSDSMSMAAGERETGRLVKNGTERMKIITHKHVTHEPGTNINRVDMDSDNALVMSCMWLKKPRYFIMMSRSWTSCSVDV